MTDTPANAIRNVSDTALWVAIYRAMESERPDAIFRDPYARRLGGERGEAIVRQMPDGASMAWPMIVRTAVMDEIVARCVREGARTVLNLAAGLDARPYRMDLPPDLRWIHVDMPDMLAYFTAHMANETPKCRLDFVAADLREADVRRALFADASREGPVLVITEGLLVYLPSDDVAALARDLHDVARALVAQRSRLADAAEVPREEMVPDAGIGERPVPVRAGGRHRVLRPLRLARNRMALVVDRIVPPQPQDAPRLVVEPPRQAATEGEAGGRQAHVRHHAAPIRSLILSRIPMT